MEKVRLLFCSKATIKALYVDGTHTPCKRKGDKTGYQGRKKAYDYKYACPLSRERITSCLLKSYCGKS
ncbi:MAG: hypothetical protein IPK11_15400 [Ignavibacteria bacterium]|nr:hypothetical protein [Ignavibacteria bacterium]